LYNSEAIHNVENSINFIIGYYSGFNVSKSDAQFFFNQ